MKAPIVIASLFKNAREQVRICLDSYQGVDLIDMRITVELGETAGVRTPTKKGLSLRVEQLPDLIAALQKAQVAAQSEGILEAAA